MKSLRSTSNNNYSNMSQGPTCIAPSIVGRSARAQRRRRLRVVNLTARAAAGGAPLACVHYHKSKLLYRCIIIIITYLYVCIHIYISLSLFTGRVHPRGTHRRRSKLLSMRQRRAWGLWSGPWWKRWLGQRRRGR